MYERLAIEQLNYNCCLCIYQLIGSPTAIDGSLLPFFKGQIKSQKWCSFIYATNRWWRQEWTFISDSNV